MERSSRMTRSRTQSSPKDLYSIRLQGFSEATNLNAGQPRTTETILADQGYAATLLTSQFLSVETVHVCGDPLHGPVFSSPLPNGRKTSVFLSL